MVTKLAIDLGGAYTNIYSDNNGIVLSEPSTVAIDSETQKIKAIGIEAKRLIGKTAQRTTIVFPVFEGDIVNPELAKSMLEYFLDKISTKKTRGKIHAVFSLPCGADEIMINKYIRIASQCNILKTEFVMVPMLSALGHNNLLNNFSPCFIVDIGAGTTNIGAVSLDGIIAGISMNIGGGNIDAHLIDYIADTFSIKIGLLTAEKLKMQIGSLYEKDYTKTVVNGRDIITGRPKSIEITAGEIKLPISIYIDKIIEYTENVMSKLPAEVSAEIRHTGIFLSGGTARIAGISDYFSSELNMNVNTIEEPEMAVIQGGGIAINNNQILNSIKIKIK